MKDRDQIDPEPEATTINAGPQLMAGGVPPAPPSGIAVHPVEALRSRKGQARHKLTNSDMEKIIRHREAIVHEGRILTTLAELPSVADLASGDEDAERAALETLRRQREMIDAEERKVMTAKADRQAAAQAEAKPSDTKPGEARSTDRPPDRPGEARPDRPTPPAGTTFPGSEKPPESRGGGNPGQGPRR